MLISKGGSSRILLIFRSMKATGEFPALRGKGVFGSLPSVFDNLLCSFTLIIYGHCLFSEKVDKFFLPFSTLFSDFS